MTALGGSNNKGLACLLASDSWKAAVRVENVVDSSGKKPVTTNVLFPPLDSPELASADPAGARATVFTFEWGNQNALANRDTPAFARTACTERFFEKVAPCRTEPVTSGTLPTIDSENIFQDTPKVSD